ncbi:hypothetical protein [Pyxidicoccus trucidator]|uniref:hypothetical protein n=1 Tax=Pyxidicoccus trucidator TaxID=2709662 RepID=UPI0013DCC64B|nr:hypothetical protein [Pyxidicoccus trucidator]
MKSLRFSLLAAFALSATACNVDPDLAQMESAEMDAQSQAATTTPPPPIPNYCPSSIPAAPGSSTSRPTPLSSYDTSPLYPTGAGLRSAYTVIVTDPASPSGSWLAFGFDVKAQRQVFYVSGQNARELRLLLIKLATDLDNLEQDTGTDSSFSWGMSGQVGGPILPQPGVHEGAWKVAWNNTYQMQLYMR